MSGKQRKTGSDKLQERAQALIERGLTSYRKGEVEAAVIDWRHALALDPHADRAREYIEHAQAHKDIDSDRDADIGAEGSQATAEPGEHRVAAAAGSGARVADGTQPDAGRAPQGRTPTSPSLPRVLRKTFEGPPMPTERLAGHVTGHSDGTATERMTPADVDSTVYPMEPMDTQPLAISREAAEVADTLPPMTAFIEEMPTEDTEPLHRPPPGLVEDEPPAPLAPTVELPRSDMERLSQGAPEKANIRTLARTQLDALETYEIHLPQPDTAARADRSKRSALPPVVIEDVEEDDAPPPPSPAGRDPSRPRTQTAQLYGGARPPVPSRPPAGVSSSISRVSIALPPDEPDEDAGREEFPEPEDAPLSARRRRPNTSVPDPDEPDLPPPPPKASKPPRANLRPEPPRAEPEPAGPMDPVARMLLERLEAEKPLRRGDENSRRDRVLWLIEYAQSEYIGGDYQTAVTALDLALDEAPDSASVQNLIEERTQSLIEIYASYEGDPSAVPSLAMSPSEYGQRALDSHAAFLLSRVDGMLTIDDLMTVSGMPVLEAHRHLCNLLRQGILTLR